MRISIGRAVIREAYQHLSVKNDVETSLLKKRALASNDFTSIHYSASRLNRKAGAQYNACALRDTLNEPGSSK
jgi:hypothetical protein